MFAVQEVQELISPSIRTLIKSQELYDQLAQEAGIIVKSNTTVDITVPPQQWVKLPFCWILEYIASPRLSGPTPEYLKMIQEHYRDALRMLSVQGTGGSSISSHVGTINGLWEV